MPDADALARVRDFLKQIWIDNTEEEAAAVWRRRVEINPAWAERSLAALDAVLADPPDDLRQELERHGWISLYHRPDPSTVTPYTQAETLAWLREMTARFRAVR